MGVEVSLVKAATETQPEQWIQPAVWGWGWVRDVCGITFGLGGEVTAAALCTVYCSPEKQATEGVVLPACSQVLRMVDTGANIMG